ncbi:MAG: hypothetical protein HRT88_11510 [Lentisphaeraceae bacterium]|nr:hypothetical protein [Lentisphaeraceae bacterium]
MTNHLTSFAPLIISAASSTLTEGSNWKFVCGGGVAVYLFKLLQKNQSTQMSELKKEVETFKGLVNQINDKYIKEIRARERAEAENKELRKTIIRLTPKETAK